MAIVQRSNPKAFETLDLKLRQLSQVEGRVGWFETAKYEDGTPVAYVAAIQELGSPANRIPPRPFMRPTAIANKQKWAETAARAAGSLLKSGAIGVDLMEIITLQAEGDISKTIAQLTSPPLSPVTIELRAMKARDPSLKIGATQVWEAIRKVKTPGYQTPSVSTKPLNDSGLMIATLTHIVEKTS